MATPYFFDGSTTLTFPRGVQLPGNEPLRKIQATDRTAAGGLVVEDLGITTQQIALVFNGMDKATTFAGLKSFFDTSANGAANSFSYYDHDGTAHTVRILSPVLDFSEFEPGIMEGQLLLEVV